MKSNIAQSQETFAQRSNKKEHFAELGLVLAGKLNPHEATELKALFV